MALDIGGVIVEVGPAAEAIFEPLECAGLALKTVFGRAGVQEAASS